MSETILRREIKKAIDRLPLDRLESVADFVAFLNRPTLRERIEKAERDLKANKGVNWRKSETMFEVVLSPSASTFYAGADRPLALKLARCFRQLEDEPRRGNNIKRLKGEWTGYLRYRVGDWRVIYRIDVGAGLVHVVTIAHRREVYE